MPLASPDPLAISGVVAAITVFWIMLWVVAGWPDERNGYGRKGGDPFPPRPVPPLLKINQDAVRDRAIPPAHPKCAYCGSAQVPGSLLCQGCGAAYRSILSVPPGPRASIRLPTENPAFITGDRPRMPPPSPPNPVYLSPNITAGMHWRGDEECDELVGDGKIISRVCRRVPPPGPPSYIR